MVLPGLKVTAWAGVSIASCAELMLREISLSCTMFSMSTSLLSRIKEAKPLTESWESKVADLRLELVLISSLCPAQRLSLRGCCGVDILEKCGVLGLPVGAVKRLGIQCRADARTCQNMADKRSAGMAIAKRTRQKKVVWG